MALRKRNASTDWTLSTQNTQMTLQMASGEKSQIYFLVLDSDLDNIKSVTI